MMFLVFLSTGASASAETTPAVRLSAAEATSTIGPLFTFTSKLIGRAHVANLAPEKHVFAAYHVRGSNNATVQDWTTVDARWMSGEDWEFETPSYVGQCPHYCAELIFEFAIGYQVDGQTHWDNNGGWNYQVASDIGPIPGDPGPPALLGDAHVMLADSSWSASDATWRGRIILDNLGFQKSVELVFSTDGWKTVRSASAQYWQSTIHAMEYWTFAVPMGAASSDVDFAIRYQVDGRTYWDNHLGVNYRVVGPRLVFHETFDDRKALLHPTLGPDGTLVGTPTFVQGSVGRAYYVTPDRSGALSYPGSVVPDDRGTIECQVLLDKPPQVIPWHASPYFFLAPVGDYTQYTVGMNGNDGWGGGGLVAWAGHGNTATGCFAGSYTYDDVLGGANQAGSWHRFTLAWDKNGIPGANNTMQLYLDGKPVGSPSFCGEEHHPDRFGRPTELLVGFIQDNFAGSAFAIDELKIWNYARSE